MKCHNHPISAEKISNGTGVLSEGENVWREGKCWELGEDCWQGDQAEVLKGSSLCCFFFLFSAPLSPAGDSAGLQHWSSLIMAPARVTQYHGGCNTKGRVLNGSHGWAGLAFKQWQRSSTKALPLKQGDKQWLTHIRQQFFFKAYLVTMRNTKGFLLLFRAGWVYIPTTRSLLSLQKRRI